jgi:hypothetical protein
MTLTAPILDRVAKPNPRTAHASRKPPSHPRHLRQGVRQVRHPGRQAGAVHVGDTVDLRTDLRTATVRHIAPGARRARARALKPSSRPSPRCSSLLDLPPGFLTRRCKLFGTDCILRNTITSFVRHVIVSRSGWTTARVAFARSGGEKLGSRRVKTCPCRVNRRSCHLPTRAPRLRFCLVLGGLGEPSALHSPSVATLAPIRRLYEASRSGWLRRADLTGPHHPQVWVGARRRRPPESRC